jgi:transcriptional regulator with XRE-family HTH domain
VRTIRDFLDMSQEQVARAAGVSQGAVSRLEAAHGLATPHLVVLKVQQVLARRLQAIDPTLLNDELRRAIDVARTLEAPLGGGDLRVTDDPHLAQFVELYQQIPERHRDSLLMLLRAAVDGLKTTGR